MAKVFGKASKYLVKKEQGHRRGAKFALYCVTGLAGILFAYSVDTLTSDQDINYKIISYTLAGLAYLIIAWYILRRFSQSETNAGKYQRGGQGEDLTFGVLNSLSDQYYWLWRDLKINYGNIDFVLARRNQMFSIEAKNISGPISYNGLELLRFGKPIRSGDFLRQTQNEYLYLKQFLNRHTGQDIPIIPLIVLTGKDVWVEFNVTRPVKNGIYVMPLRMLKGFVEGFPSRNIVLNMGQLELALGKLLAE